MGLYHSQGPSTRPMSSRICPSILSSSLSSLTGKATSGFITTSWTEICLDKNSALAVVETSHLGTHSTMRPKKDFRSEWLQRMGDKMTQQESTSQSSTSMIGTP